LGVLENDICAEVDKYIANIPMNQERAKKMQEGKKAKAQGTPQSEPTPKPEITPTPEPKKTGIGGLILGLGLVILTGGLAAKYLRK